MNLEPCHLWKTVHEDPGKSIRRKSIKISYRSLGETGRRNKLCIKKKRRKLQLMNNDVYTYFLSKRNAKANAQSVVRLHLLQSTKMKSHHKTPTFVVFSH